jgi:hypothetical protein
MPAPRPALPDPRASRAVLVGVSDYRTLEPLPAVENNIATLRSVITDTELWGLSDEHCVALLNPSSVDTVLDAVHTAASEASDTLLFYFAGHGLLDDRSDLYLGLAGSAADRLYRAVRYDDIRREVVGTARACYGKVVILDCCYSGRALQGGMGASVNLADHAQADGTYLMTASAETSVALAPPSEQYTAFTGALLDKLTRGLPDGPEVLDMETLFYHVRSDLQARHFPVPQQRTRNDGRAIALVRNRRGSARRTTQPQPEATTRLLPQPPAAMASLMRCRPSEMYAEVQALRGHRHDELAEQVLAASGALRADQTVAAIVNLLHDQNAEADVRTVIAGAALRAPGEVLRIIDALNETDLPTEAIRLVRAAGDGNVEDAANLAYLLQARQRLRELHELLDAALETAQARSSLIGLINTLWMAGLREEVDRLLARTASKLPGPAVVGLADELRAVGREDAAFGLYAASAEALVTRTPDFVAQLCRAMTESGRVADSAHVAEILIERADDVAMLHDVATAFWDTGQEEYADQVLTHAAVALTGVDVIDFAFKLHSHGHDLAAHMFCLRVSVSQPAVATRQIVAALREEGRPIDAKKLLEETAGLAPTQTVLEILDGCTDGERQRILHVVSEREPVDVAQLLNALVSTQPEVARQLVELITITAETRPELRPVIVDKLAPKVKEQMFTTIVQSEDAQSVEGLLRILPADDAKFLMFLAVRAGGQAREAAIRCVEGVAGHAPQNFLLHQPLERLPVLVTEFWDSRFQRHAETLLAQTAASERGELAIARDVSQLFSSGEVVTAEMVLDRALYQRTKDELVSLVEALREQHRPEALATVANWLKETHIGQGPTNVDGILNLVGLGEYASRRSQPKRRWKTRESE